MMGIRRWIRRFCKLSLQMRSAKQCLLCLIPWLKDLPIQEQELDMPVQIFQNLDCPVPLTCPVLGETDMSISIENNLLPTKRKHTVVCNLVKHRMPSWSPEAPNLSPEARIWLEGLPVVERIVHSNKKMDLERAQSRYISRGVQIFFRIRLDPIGSGFVHPPGVQ